MKIANSTILAHENRSDTIEEIITHAQRDIASTGNTKHAIHLEGLDVTSVESGAVHVLMPLRGTSCKLKLGTASCKLITKSETFLQIDATIGSEQGEARIQVLDIKLSRPVKITKLGNLLNFEDSSHQVHKWLKNKFCRLEITSIQVDGQGQIRINGDLVIAGVYRKSIEKLISPDVLVPLDLRVSVLAQVFSHAYETGGNVTYLKSLFDTLVKLGEEGKFFACLKSKSSSIELSTTNAYIRSDAAPHEIMVRGSFFAENNNKLYVSLDEGSQIVSGIGNAQVRGDVQVADIFDGKKRVAKANTLVGGNFDGFHGNFAVVTTNHADCVLQDAALMGDAALTLVCDRQGFHVEDGKIDSQITFKEPTGMISGLKTHLNGAVKGALRAHSIRYLPGFETPVAVGDCQIEFAPNLDLIREFPALKPVQQNYQFKTTHNGRLTLKPEKNSLLEFLSPFTDLDGYPRRMVNPRAPLQAAPGSDALKRHITKLTGARVYTGNHVKILADGVMSLPERLKLIAKARKSVCLQTLILKEGEGGDQIAAALIAAAKRGVAVYVIVDSLGNIQSFEDMINRNPIYQKLKCGGVKLCVYQNEAEEGIRSILTAIKNNLDIFGIKSLEDLKNPTKAMSVAKKTTLIVHGKMPVKTSLKRELIAGLNQLLHAMSSNATFVMAQDLQGVVRNEQIDLVQVLSVFEKICDFNYRWHEKIFVVDGEHAILGGINMADEYLLGGTGRKVRLSGRLKTSWRDIDIALSGPAALKVYENFAENWRHTSGERLPTIKASYRPTSGNNVDVQVIEHRPHLDGDHHTANFMVENLKTCQAGDRAYFEHAYFNPSSSLETFKEALIDAAKRGVDVRVLTNSETTTDLPPFPMAQVFPFRELLEAGVRIFERIGDRMLHSKVAVFGSRVVAIGSWNADNRSEAINSEIIAVVYDDETAKSMEKMLCADMEPDVAREIRLEEISSLPIKEELRNAAAAMIGDVI